MVALGYIVLVVGILAALYWQLRFLVVAYDRGFWWLFGCLFIPFLDLIFLALNFKATVKPYVLSLAGLLLVCLGTWLSGASWPG